MHYSIQKIIRREGGYAFSKVHRFQANSDEVPRPTNGGNKESGQTSTHGKWTMLSKNESFAT